MNGDISINASVSGGKGKSNGQVVENVESLVTARDTLTIESGKDTNIIGSQVAGNTVVADIGGDLNIESLQDKDNYHEKNSNWNAGGSISATGVPSFSGGASQQKIDSEYKSVNEQAGIYAGTGGFDITVGGNTDLKGAVIDSKADADKNKLSTDTLTYSDIKNEAEWSADTKGANYQKGDGVVNKDKGLTPNFAGSEGEDSSTTKSAIAPGTIEIRSDEGKAEKDKTDLADLSRDPENANNPLDKIFDKDKILEKQEAAALVGEIGFTLVGKIIKNNDWDPSDFRSIALHGLVGGLMAEINGGEFGEGMTTAAINKLIISKLSEMRDEEGKLILSGGELRWISASIGSIIGGSQGAGIADSATANNALSNRMKEQKEWELANCAQLGWNCEEVRIFWENLDNDYDRIINRNLASIYKSGLSLDQWLDLDFALANRAPGGTLITPGAFQGIYDEIMGNPKKHLNEYVDIFHLDQLLPVGTALMKAAFDGGGASQNFATDSLISQKIAQSSITTKAIEGSFSTNPTDPRSFIGQTFSNLDYDSSLTEPDLTGAIGKASYTVLNVTEGSIPGKYILTIEVTDKGDFDGFRYRNIAGVTTITPGDALNNIGYMAQLKGQLNTFDWKATVSIEYTVPGYRGW